MWGGHLVDDRSRRAAASLALDVETAAFLVASDDGVPEIRRGDGFGVRDGGAAVSLSADALPNNYYCINFLSGSRALVVSLRRRPIIPSMDV